MKKTFIFLIVNFFLINNALAEKNYLYCIETLDKVRDHFLNEGDVDGAAFIEYDDIKNTIKIHAVYPSAKKKPFLHIKKRKVEKTELGFQINLDERNGKIQMKDSYDFIKLENKIIYTRSTYINFPKTSKNEALLMDHDNTGKCENIDKIKYKSLLKQKSWNLK
jgi:hypothetical protein